jgi:2-methylcitrate dehydratase PrpD
VFSGERDFFHTFAPKAERKLLSLGLGRNYEILRCGIKRWTVGGPIQGPLHVLYELLQKYRFSASDVKQLVVRMPDKELETVSNRSMPNICVQHLLALMLFDGKMTFQSAHDQARMSDPAVLELRKRIKVVGDAQLTDALRRWRSVIEVTLKDGRKLSHQTMAAKGTFEDPLNRREEEEKAIDLIGPVFGKARTQTLLKTLWGFDRIGDIRSLQALIKT